MQSVTAGWVLTLLIGAQADAPWKSTYETTAEAMADSANAEPLFAGNDGPARTVAYYVAVSWYEATLNPKAEGDHDCLARDAAGKCTKKGAPHSFCLGQINDSNHAGLGVTKEQLVADVRVCIHAMNVMLRRSLKICGAAFPGEFEQGLGWYVAGGPTCTRSDKSAHRVRKARWLFAHYPVQ